MSRLGKQEHSLPALALQNPQLRVLSSQETMGDDCLPCLDSDSGWMGEGIEAGF